MSRRRGNDLDDLDVEVELEYAFAELDSKIPVGYFATFSSKVAASLEREASMQPRRTEISPETGPTPPPRDEHSGLHEIKALAQTAQKRIRSRRTSESDVEQAMLSTSSSALSAVVLPDPEASSQIAIAAPPETPIVEVVPAPPGVPTWLWAAGGTALLAAAAAAVLFIFSRGGGDSDPQSTVAVADRADEPAVETAPPPMPAPASEPVVEAAPEYNDSDDADGEEAPAAEPTPEPEPRVANDEQAKPKAASSRQTRRERDRAKSDPPREPPRAAKEKETREAAKRADHKADSGGTDLETLLDRAAGAEPDKPKAIAEVETKKVDKKRLDSGDVRDAMGAVSGAVKACQKTTGFSGRVSVKFSVSPSGSVGKVKASGGDSAVHSCVASAVKRARFPSFEPPAMSFSYSFLISD